MNLQAPSERQPAPVEQGGQALAELLVAVLALALLWAAAAWLGRLQDMALQAGHAARHLAFTGTQQGDADWAQLARAAYLDGQRQRWNDSRGRDLLPWGRSVQASLMRVAPLVLAAQPGHGHAQGALLRNDWQLADTGVLQAGVVVEPAAAPRPQGGEASGNLLRSLDASSPVIRRQAYILTGAGHADDDADALRRVAQAVVPWAQASGVSYGVSGRVANTMQRVDQAWGRPGPDNDWLGLWQEWVPDGHVMKREARP